MLQPKITKVCALPGSMLEVSFETGESGIFDVSPYIEGSWYGRLSDPDYFQTIHIIQDGLGIEWADGQDIAPHELYDAIARVRQRPGPTRHGI